jgi:hypothetical protein
MTTCKVLLLSACWSIMVLSAAGVSAGAGDNGIPLNGLTLHDTSQHGVGTAAGHRDPAGQVVVTSHSAQPSAVSPRQIALANPDLASTAEKRHQLTYLVRCALPKTVVLYAAQGGERFTFQGSMGLAPHWLYEAMTPSEERWVSACLLAHVNYFGKHVRVSMRATDPPVSALEATEEEKKTFAIFEGGFFGNLFSPNPVAYTCQGERTRDQMRDPIFQDRVCTKETGVTTAEGKPFTLCRFVGTGRCEDAHSFTVDGTPYSEVVFTYLRAKNEDAPRVAPEPKSMP